MSAFGYGSPEYGRSFREFGEVITLPRSRLPVIKRPLDRDRFDIAGLYPFSVCGDWSGLADDAKTMRDLGAISVVLVADPFAEEAARNFLSCWSVCDRFKTQFVVNLREDWRALRPKKIRHLARQALRLQTVDVVANPVEHAEILWALYQQTIEKHAIAGIQRLSLEAVTAQLGVEGAVMVVARQDDAVHGAMISYDMGEVAHLHLVGQSAAGYAIKTSYALIHRSLEVLESRGCTFANLGGQSGLSDDTEDGLSRFKSRWTKHRRSSLLCGQILDPCAYDSLVERARCQPGTFFPAYRTPGGRFEWQPGCRQTVVREPPRAPTGSL